MWQILHLVPKNYLSFVIGKLVSVKLPRPFSTWLVAWFAKRYKIDLSRASKDISEYRSISELFTRDLKNYIVPYGFMLVSPAESKLRDAGDIISGQIVQVKGVSYSIETLLGDETSAREFREGMYFNFYLSPKDYHQVHSPLRGRITGSTYIKGKLWPVNDWSLNSIHGLFCVNERVVTYITSENGVKAALVMVGATNVGKISVSFDNWLTNNISATGLEEINHRDYAPPKEIRQGEKLGIFHMGSAVVLILNSRYSLSSVELNEHVDLFQPLIKP